MKPLGTGRHCGSCENIVYDFSQMTDAEPFRFFQQNSATHCGRFHNSQLNRDIETIHIKNKFYRRFAKMAATVLAILTFRSTPAKAQGQIIMPVSEVAPKNRAVVQPLDSFIIKGSVTDGVSPLAGAFVRIGHFKKTFADDKGLFECKMPGDNTALTIYISSPGFIDAVRTYHPSMGSTDFNIVMSQTRDGRDHTMGRASSHFFSSN